MRLNRNILVHSALYTIFFFGGALAMFLRTLLGTPAAPTTNLVLEFLSAALYFRLGDFSYSQGRGGPGFIPRAFGSRHEQHALRQLETLNATLLKVSRK